jgi:hypothetical protein
MYSTVPISIIYFHEDNRITSFCTIITKSSAFGTISCFKMTTGEMNITSKPGHQGYTLAWQQAGYIRWTDQARSKISKFRQAGSSELDQKIHGN